jgi:Uma2 family endonuclease
MSRMTGHQHTDEARASGRKLTYRDLLRFPEDGRRHELIDGKHYVTASPNLWHQRLSVRLTKAFLDYLASHPMGELFYAPLDVVMSKFDIVVPDLLLIACDQSDIVTGKNVRGAPALLIEINSPSTRARDRRLKRDLYSRAGVREYWIVDPQTASISIFRRTAGGEFPLVSTMQASSGAEVTSPLLPGFSLSLPTLFRGL